MIAFLTICFAGLCWLLVRFGVLKKGAGTYSALAGVYLVFIIGIVIGPDGDVLVETVEPVTHATLERETVTAARKNYPGYLDVRADLYAKTWGSLS